MTAAVHSARCARAGRDRRQAVRGAFASGPSVAVRVAPALALLLGVTLALTSCSSNSSSNAPSGFYHAVRPGENLYRIGLRYGVPARVLVKMNRIRDVHSMRVGTKIWIPRSRARVARSSRSSAPRRAAAPPARRTSGEEARRQARREASRSSKLSFAWPVRGRLTSSFGLRGGRPHEGVDLAARKGTSIYASEAGKVIHSGRLGDYGNVVIVKHAGHYRTVYAHASKTLVRKGQFVEKRQKIALVGRTGRATGPHLHFEIRRRETPRNPMLYLR